MLDTGEHATCVDAWLKHSAKGLSPERLVELLEAALGALWGRTQVTLGEVTLAAISDRVLHHAAEKVPLFSEIKIEPGVGPRCHGLAERVGVLTASEVKEAIRFVLVEFLTVLGNLTAEVLTPELHEELSQAELKDAAPSVGTNVEDKGS